jgi:alpha-ribazole phosphatase
MRLYLVRHPRPSDSIRLCYGRRDVPVAPAAVAEAASAVREAIPQAVLHEAPIYSSPSTRALELARALAAPREPRVNENLREMGFGAWEGRTWDAIPRAEIDAWAEDVWGYRAGGDESAAMVRDRWQRFCAALRGVRPIRDLIAVTHSGVIRVALVTAGLLSEEGFPRAPIEYASVHPIDVPA